MAMTVNNLTSLSLLDMLRRTENQQQDIFSQMATGSKINRGADDPAGLLAITQMDSELTALKAGITNNQRTDAMLGVADNALAELGNLIDEVQRLANESANDAALSADEVAANQSQIDDALSSIDRIVSNTQFNGKKLIDGSLGVYATVSDTSKVTDVRAYSRETGSTDMSLAVEIQSVASVAAVSNFLAADPSADTSFMVQGKLGTAIIEVQSGMGDASMASKINETTNQTGVSAGTGGGGNGLVLYSTETGAESFVRTQLIEGDSTYQSKQDYGVDAVVSVNGQTTAVDGNSVNYSGAGASVSFELDSSVAAGDTVTITLAGDTGATFQLGVNEHTRNTIGIAGAYTHQLGSREEGYLSSLKSGGTNSLLNDPAQAAKISRIAAKQVSTLQGRIGGFQKFQVRTAINSLTDTKEGVETARGVVADVDYAQASAELNRVQVLMQSTIQLLGVSNQQASQVLSLLR